MFLLPFFFLLLRHACAEKGLSPFSFLHRILHCVSRRAPCPSSSAPSCLTTHHTYAVVLLVVFPARRPLALCSWGSGVFWISSPAVIQEFLRATSTAPQKQYGRCAYRSIRIPYILTSSFAVSGYCLLRRPTSIRRLPVLFPPRATTPAHFPWFACLPLRLPVDPRPAFPLAALCADLDSALSPCRLCAYLAVFFCAHHCHRHTNTPALQGSSVSYYGWRRPRRKPCHSFPLSLF